jgi:hypothetical protein
MSLKNYSDLPAPMLSARIRIVTMRIRQLFLNYWRGSGSDIYGSGTL